MSKERVGLFFKKVSQDEELKKKILSLPADKVKAAEMMFIIAEQAGVSLTKQDCLDYAKARQELKDSNDPDIDSACRTFSKACEFVLRLLVELSI